MSDVFKRIHADRLSKLADHLDKVKPEAFNLSCWAYQPGGTQCGTVACAMGHACMMPEFNYWGLHLTRDRGLVPAYADGLDVHLGWDAAHQFFGLSSKESTALFNEDSYPAGYNTPPTVVAETIREFVKQKERSS